MTFFMIGYQGDKGFSVLSEVEFQKPGIAHAHCPWKKMPTLQKKGNFSSS